MDDRHCMDDRRVCGVRGMSRPRVSFSFDIRNNEISQNIPC